MANSNDKDAIAGNVKDILTEYLELKGMRKTPERYAILNAIYAMNGHFTVDSLHEKMCDEKFFVSKATLFNAINLFIEANLVVRHHFGNIVQYEKIVGVKPHLHAVCNVCGKVNEVKSVLIDNSIDNVKVKRFRAVYYDLVIYGVCSSCQSRISRLRNKQKQNKK